MGVGAQTKEFRVFIDLPKLVARRAELLLITPPGFTPKNPQKSRFLGPQASDLGFWGPNASPLLAKNSENSPFLATVASEGNGEGLLQPGPGKPVSSPKWAQTPKSTDVDFGQFLGAPRGPPKMSKMGPKLTPKMAIFGVILGSFLGHFLAIFGVIFGGSDPPKMPENRAKPVFCYPLLALFS